MPQGALMSEYAEPHRRAMKAKAHRMANGDDEHGHVDATTVKRPEAFDGGKPTYPIRPKPRAYKRGGKVEGEHAQHHAGKKPRTHKNVGGLLDQKLIPLATGGRAHSDEAEDRSLIKKMVKSEARTERAHGGKTGGKGKTNINIVIAQPHSGQGEPGMDAGPLAAKPAGMPIPMPAMGPGAPPPAAMPVPVPSSGGQGNPGMGGPMPQMPRRAGGRIPKDAGVATGVARLEQAGLRARD